MKVSIIIPVYNVFPYLRRCLDSVINQTLKDLEIIIVDDGSTDGCSVLLDEYARNDSRLVVVHKENGGLMSAWTAGVRISHGDYIGFVDSDDYVSTEMYELMYNSAVHYDTDIVICNYSINHSIEGKLKTELAEGRYSGEKLRIQIKEHVLSYPNDYSLPLCRWNKLYRRRIALDCLRYTDCLSRTFEDRYYVPATLLSANSIYCLDDVLYYWMQRAGSNHGLYKPGLLEDIKRYYFIQHRIVEDCAPYLEKRWEASFCDGIKQYVIRNIINVSNFRSRYLSSKVLFNDSLVKDRLHKYGSLMTNRMGKLLHVCQLIDSPFLFSIACSFWRHFA